MTPGARISFTSGWYYVATAVTLTGTLRCLHLFRRYVRQALPRQCICSLLCRPVSVLERLGVVPEDMTGKDLRKGDHSKNTRTDHDEMH